MSNDPPDLMALLARLLGVTRESLAGDDASAVRARVEAVRAAMERMVPIGAERGRDESDAGARAEPDPPPDALQLAGQVAALRAALAGTGMTAVVGAPSADEEGPLDFARLATLFATLGDSLERVGRTAAHGAEVDSIVRRLEETFDPMAGEAARAATRERDERVERAVSSSISGRLRQAGIKPGDDS
jgi:hypothetical protein